MISVLLPVVALLGLGWSLRRLQGGWLAPGPSFAVYWAAALALPAVLAPDYVRSTAAVWFIVVLVGSFCLGSAMAASRAPERTAERLSRPVNLSALRRFVVAGTVAGVLATLVVQAANGYSLGSILSGRGLLDAAAAFSADRYTGRTTMPIAVPLLMSMTYASALVAPLAARGLTRARAVACYLGPFVGAASYAVVTTARLGMLTVAFFLLAGWMAARAGSGGSTRRIGFRALVAVTAGLVGLATLFVLIAMLRVGSFDAQIRNIILAKMLAYTVGYMPVFSQWWDQSAPTWPETWGSATFAGLLDVGRGGSAGFDEYLPLGDGSGVANIYTAWRFLIEDYGVVGAPLAAALLGWVATAAWRTAVMNGSPLAVTGLMAAYGYTLNSTTQSVFLFTNIVLAFVIAAVLLGVLPALPGSRKSGHQSDRLPLAPPLAPVRGGFVPAHATGRGSPSIQARRRERADAGVTRLAVGPQHGGAVHPGARPGSSRDARTGPRSRR